MLTGKEHRRGSREMYLRSAIQHLNCYSFVFGHQIRRPLQRNTEA